MSGDIQRNRDMRMLKGLEHLSQDRLRELGLFSLERSQQNRGFYQYTGIFSVGLKRRGPHAFHSNRKRGGGHKQTGNSTQT